MCMHTYVSNYEKIKVWVQYDLVNDHQCCMFSTVCDSMEKVVKLITCVVGFEGILLIAAVSNITQTYTTRKWQKYHGTVNM